MTYTRYPSYYKAFRCIASACSDSCCIGWEIDIDEDTVKKYRQIEGDFGKRLQENIQIFQEQGKECACFAMDETKRCPFLNQENLCDIILNLGEEYLGQICTDHPRYYDWFLDGQECGVGLCCEEAARLILEGKEFRLVQEEVCQEEAYSGENTEISDGLADKNTLSDEQVHEPLSEALQEESEEREFEQKLFPMREELFSEISCKKEWFETMNSLYDMAYQLQDEYDAWLFEEDEWAEPEGETQEEFPTWEETFWQQEFLSELLDFYLDLEINKEQWREWLQEAKEQIPQILSWRASFEKNHQELSSQYKQLLYYFVYRHFMSARQDDEVAEKVIFALISTSMIELLGIWIWLQNGKEQFTLEQQIAICKMYSQEIEYHEENMNKVAGCMKFLEG